MSFNDLGLNKQLLKAIEDKGYTEASPIQREAIPLIFSGRDLLASSQTGTGKTASFALPILQMLSTDAGEPTHAPRALILTPTRELATQVAENIAYYGRHLSLKSTAIFGGVSIAPQIDRLKRGLDIITATPGRLLDLIQQKKIDLSKIKIVTLDEADRMLDMGFVNDIKSILTRISSKRQTLMFSATYSTEIKYLTKTFQKDPAFIEVAPENSTAEKVNQSAYMVQKASKPNLLIHLIKTEKWKQALVFTRTKHFANRLVERLLKEGITASAIHSNKSQSARVRALKSFKDGEVTILVATDIAARGIDIALLPYVVNYELPNVPEDYVHRIGRTARAGNSGEAISFVSDEEKAFLKGIERIIHQKIRVNQLPPIKHPKAHSEGAGGDSRNYKAKKQYASSSNQNQKNKPAAQKSTKSKFYDNKKSQPNQNKSDKGSFGGDKRKPFNRENPVR